MMTLWHALRQTRLIAALIERIRLLEERCALCRHENQLLSLRCESLAAQLETSRLLHAKALQQVDRLEVAQEHLYFELNSHKRRHRRQRLAMRSWITRQTKPRITAN